MSLVIHLQSTFFELREQHQQLYEQIFKEHKKECLKYEEEIERLNDIIRIKDAYLICINETWGGGDKLLFYIFNVFITKYVSF